MGRPRSLGRRYAAPRTVVLWLAMLGSVRAVPVAELEALATIKNMNVQSPCTQQWFESDDPCEGPWPNVVCTTSNSNVAALKLTSCLLTSWLDPSLGNLTQLQILRFGDNAISGTVPSSLARLSLLESFEVYSTQIEGAFPAWLADLPRLKEIRAQNTMLSGELPSSLANLVNLTYFHAGRCQLSGKLPPFSTPNLVELIVDTNVLYGEIPVTLGSCAGLQILELQGNGFNGPLPEGVAKLGGLVHLNVSTNSLSGGINVVSSQYLQVLDVSRNNFSGPLPALYSTDVVVIDMSYNGFAGPVPEDFVASSANLRQLVLSHNALTAVPTILYLPNSLDVVYLDHNQLSGAIPASLIAVPRVVDLSFNNFSGPIPDVVFPWSPLSALLLASQGVTEDGDVVGPGLDGGLPVSVLAAPSLEYVLLSVNHLSGAIPKNVSRSLKQVEFGFNRLNGPLPGWGMLANLSRLGLDHNMLSGDVARDSLPWSALRFVSIATNYFSGPASDVSVGSDYEYVDVLRGGIFLCPLSRVLETYDPDAGAYMCYSTGLFTELIVGGSFLCCVIILVGCSYVTRDDGVDDHRMRRGLSGGEGANLHACLEVVLAKSFAKMMLTVVTAMGVVAIVLAYVYDVSPSRYSERYELSFSAAYAGDGGVSWQSSVTAALCLCLFGISVAAWLWHRRRRRWYFSDSERQRPLEYRSPPEPGQQVKVSCTVLFLVALASGLHTGFVYCVSSSTVYSWVKRVCEVLMALFLLLNNEVIVPMVARYVTGAPLRRPTYWQRRRLVSRHIRYMVYFAITTSVAVPVLVSVLFLPRCLLYQITQVGDVAEAEVVVNSCLTWETWCSVPPSEGFYGPCPASNLTTDCELYLPQPRDVSVPFLYEYDDACPGSFIDIYGQVYVLLLAGEGIVLGGMRLLLTLEPVAALSEGLRGRLQMRGRLPALRHAIIVYLSPLSWQRSLPLRYARAVTTLGIGLIIGSYDVRVIGTAFVSIVAHAIVDLRNIGQLYSETLPARVSGAQGVSDGAFVYVFLVHAVVTCFIFLGGAFPSLLGKALGFIMIGVLSLAKVAVLLMDDHDHGRSGRGGSGDENDEDFDPARDVRLQESPGGAHPYRKMAGGARE